MDGISWDPFDTFRLVLTQSRDDYLSKLSQINSTGFFNVLSTLFKRRIEIDSQLKIFRFWNVLVNTCFSHDEVSLLFRDGLASGFIEFPCTSPHLIWCAVMWLFWKASAWNCILWTQKHFFAQRKVPTHFSKHCSIHFIQWFGDNFSRSIGYFESLPFMKERYCSVHCKHS
jgi:hypothetical protein